MLYTLVRKRLGAAGAVLVALFALPARARGVEASRALEGEVLEDEWMIVQVVRQRVGYQHGLTVKKGDLVTSTVTQFIEMTRDATPVRQETEVQYKERADGTPLGFVVKMSGAARNMTIEGRIADGKLALTSRTLGEERTKTEEWPEGTMIGYALNSYIKREIARGRKEFSFRTFSVEIAKFVNVTYKVVGWEKIEVLGRRARVRKSLVSGLVPGLTHTEYRDSDGTVWKVDMGILQMEVLRATREQALQKSPAFGGFDALGDIMVRVKTRLARPREVRSALYRLRLKEGKASDLKLEGPGQKVERTAGDGSVLLRVKSVKPDPERVVPHPIRDPDMKKYLDPSTFVQSDDAEIVRVAREVASEVRSSYAAAKRLELWVYRNIREKNLDRAFASAKEVMQDRAGDCTEHAVLLAALLRAAGIPSRGASGILYFELPGAGPAFAYHMWTEAYVGDWVPLDATLAGSFVDATHIRLAESDLAAMSPAAGMLEIVQVFGRLKIEIVEYAAGERPVRPGGNKRRSFIETRYRDLDYGLSFAVPEGWDVLHAGDPGIVEKGAVTCLVRRGAKERMVLFARDVAPGAILSEVVDRQTARFDVKKRKRAKLGGLAALELTYEKNGRARRGFTVKREGTHYLLRLGPVTPAGSEALAEVAESFRFE